MGRNVSVFIACCNRLLRESIARILAKKSGLEISAVQAIGPGAREEIGQSEAEVLVLDSLEFLVESCAPPRGVASRIVKPVLVAMEDSHDRFLTAIRHGAQGYVLQEASALEVVSAIQTVADGEAACPAAYTRVLFDFVAKQLSDSGTRKELRDQGLTLRERQLVPMISRGLSNKEIASALHISEQTVKNHVHRILKKVGAPSRHELSEVCRLETADFLGRFSVPA